MLIIIKYLHQLMNKKINVNFYQLIIIINIIINHHLLIINMIINHPLLPFPTFIIHLCHWSTLTSWIIHLHHSLFIFIIHCLSSSFIIINSSSSYNPRLCQPGLCPWLRQLPTQQPANIYDEFNKGSGHTCTPLCHLGQIPHCIWSACWCRFQHHPWSHYAGWSWGTSIHRNLILCFGCHLGQLES